MEITVKFDELYAGEDGRVSDVVLSAIAAQLADSFTPEVREQVKGQVSRLVVGQVELLLAEELAKVLDGEFDRVDSYGHHIGKTTLRGVVADELKDAVKELGHPERNQVSPLVKMIRATVQEMVTAEVKERLAEIRKNASLVFVREAQAAVEKVR